ncbi:MAG: LysM peptidoglycan-binding domain-containing protein [Verrucomicrobiota bacterium]
MKASGLVIVLTVMVGLNPVAGGELFTNAYSVPPTFLHTGDPFAENEGSDAQPTNAKEILETAGISFPEGASAIYVPKTSQLVVRNTEEQMELVEAYVEAIKTGIEKQIYLTLREVTFSGEVWEDLELDYLFRLSPPRPFPGDARVLDSREAFKEELSGPPSKLKWAKSAGIKNIDILTDPQFQLLIRALREREGVELLEAPSVMTLSGRPVISQQEDRRYGVIPVLGSDEYSIELEIFLPEHGEALFETGDPLKTPIHEHIYDGQTVGISREDKGGVLRIVFVKAQVMDPAGTSADEEPKEAEQPKKQASESGSRISDEMSEKLGKLVQEVFPFQFRSANTHIVKKGESLYGIATDAGAMIAEIKRLNGLENDDLEVGQLLFLPADAKKAKEESFSLNEVIISGFKFTDLPFAKALGHIQEVLLSHEKVDSLFPKEAPRIILKDAERFDDIKITLQLTNVPVGEALRYITQLAECEYEIKGSRIYVFAKSEPAN